MAWNLGTGKMSGGKCRLLCDPAERALASRSGAHSADSSGTLKPSICPSVGLSTVWLVPSEPSLCASLGLGAGAGGTGGTPPPPGPGKAGPGVMIWEGTASDTCHRDAGRVDTKEAHSSASAALSPVPMQARLATRVLPALTSQTAADLSPLQNRNCFSLEVT